MLPGGDLVLENIHPSQEGVYQCRAENKIGAVTAEARVTVRERPVLTVTPETRLQVRLPVPPSYRGVNKFPQKYNPKIGKISLQKGNFLPRIPTHGQSAPLGSVC